jgi:imidazolonepropionase
MRADCIITNASEVFTCCGTAPKRGAEQGDARPIRDAAVAGVDGRIVFVGDARICEREVERLPGCTTIDATGCAIIPGFVDAHTHLVYAGDRRRELRRRLAGETYAAIATEGGGILYTVRATRDCGPDGLARTARGRLDEMLRCGTTTSEVKSGYGLTVDSELAMLRVIRRLSDEGPIELVPTFMGAHEIPPEYRDRRDMYLRLVCDEMIPRVAAERLAEFCDVFCETGIFTVEESRAILQAGVAVGLKPRVHADELASSGGAMLAAEIGARSADHLIFVEREAARAMAGAGTIATLLPAAAFYLKLGRFAPARMLIDEQVPVALATDVNPGAGFTPSMPFVIALACFGMGLTLEEALVAATINAASSVDRGDRIGSLEPGKQMDVVVVNGPAIELLRQGVQSVRTVIKKGRVVHDIRSAPREPIPHEERVKQ